MAVSVVSPSGSKKECVGSIPTPSIGENNVNVSQQALVLIGLAAWAPPWPHLPRPGTDLVGEAGDSLSGILGPYLIISTFMPRNHVLPICCPPASLQLGTDQRSSKTGQ